MLTYRNLDSQSLLIKNALKRKMGEWVIPTNPGGLMDTVLKDQEFELFGETTVDDRKRITLTKAIEVLRERFKEEPAKIHFSIYLNKAGQILLSPETSIPLDEVWIFRNSKALESVLRGIAQAKQGKVQELESFAKHADDEIE